MPLPKETNIDYFTYAQYKNWPKEERWEIIEGEAFNMSPAPGMTHQNISGELFRQIANYLSEKPCKIFAAPFDIFLPKNNESEEETSTIVQPDISIICDPSKLSEKGCLGPPNVVMEIISPSSASHDQIRKLDLYEKHAVPEYWIVHPMDRIVWKYVLENNNYGKPFIYDKNGTPSFLRFPDLQINLRKVFGIPERESVKEQVRHPYGTISKPD